MRKKKKKGEEVLMRVRPSRKQYFPFYIMTLLLAGLLIYLNIKGITISWVSVISFMVFFFLGLNFTEVHRLNTLYEITPTNIRCTYDRLLNKNVQKIDYVGISDIYVKNSVWQWILGYGDVDIRLFSKEATIKVKKINKPNAFADTVEKVMMSYRKGKNEEIKKE
ncbi:MAG TPA: PH domain-containing protein [Candidatus Nanoarchaeia archaeon]|nr:PH domain-containing protein [Candidatus Nanoarchaeia archaeon]